MLYTSDSRQGHRESRLSPTTQQVLARPDSTRHVVRYVSSHAHTWPEYTATRRTLDRSLVRCTSLSLPSNATAVNLLPATALQSAALRPVCQWPSTSGEPLDRPDRLSCGTTLRWSQSLLVMCCLTSHIDTLYVSRPFTLSLCSLHLYAVPVQVRARSRHINQAVNVYSRKTAAEAATLMFIMSGAA